jgi:hypothetical protein
MRWIPDLEAAIDASPKQQALAKFSAKQSPGVITRPSIEVHYCGCKVLPWEYCEHSAGKSHS